jgi:hypothetical protein
MKLVRDDVKSGLTETALAKGKGRLLPGFGDNLDEEQKMIAMGTWKEREQAQLMLAGGEQERRLQIGAAPTEELQSASGSGSEDGSGSESEAGSVILPAAPLQLTLGPHIFLVLSKMLFCTKLVRLVFFEIRTHTHTPDCSLIVHQCTCTHSPHPPDLTWPPVNLVPCGTR